MDEQAAQSGRAGRTRSRLVQAAGLAFAERGFDSATVREICRRAGANVSAVKYHFGSKEALYREVLIGSHRDLRDREPLPTLAGASSPEEALRGFIGFLLRFLLLRRPAHSYAGRLIAHELREPTEALTELVRLVMLPVRVELEGVLGALLGEADSQARRAEAANFTLGLCVFHELGRPVLQRFGHPPPTDAAGTEALADAITRFVLAGVRAMRDPCP